jgi:hypothetical protein
LPALYPLDNTPLDNTPRLKLARNFQIPTLRRQPDSFFYAIILLSMKPNWLMTIVIAALTGVGVYFYKPQEAGMKLSFPYTIQVNPLAGMSCEAIVGSSMYGSNNEARKGIIAELFEGTDKIAVELDSENKFNFITRAAVEAGMTKSDEGWIVARNDKKHLIAVLG